MTSIDTSGLVQRAGNFTFSDAQELDPATILLALGVQQASILHGTLLNRVQATQEPMSSLERLGRASQKLLQVRDDVVRQELNEARDLLELFESFGKSRAATESESLVIDEAEYQRLQSALDWAGERGMTVGDIAQPVVTEPTEGADSPPPPTEWTIDRAAVQQKFGVLNQYIDGLRRGVADNPALEQSIKSATGDSALVDVLSTIGLTGDIDSLQGLNAALKEIQRQVTQIAIASEGAVAQLRVLVADARQVVQTLTGAVQDSHKHESRQADNRAADTRAQLERLELDERTQQLVAELLGQQQEAAAIREQLAAVLETSDRADGVMADAVRQAAAEQLAVWQQNLDSRLADSLRNDHAASKLVRGGHMYV